MLRRRGAVLVSRLRESGWEGLGWEGPGWEGSGPVPLLPRKARAAREEDGAFADERTVHCVAGDGGMGALSFLRIFNNPFAGPDGGNGGNGGHVLFRASEHVSSLEKVPPKAVGQRGWKGENKNRDGKSAPHLEIPVPLGTVVHDASEGGSGAALKDLSTDGELFIAARGGRGGKGNNFFLSNESRAPVKAEAGGTGEERRYHLQLRSIAHAGLLGFPNAGKSSLLRAVSRAAPKVAPIPFTTLRPHVGVVEFSDARQLRLADLPGLVEGAAEGRGLGHRFLAHVHRCPLLFYVLDLSLSSPEAQLEALQRELDAYEDGLSQRPAAVLANKVDLPQSRAKLAALASLTSLPVFPVSAKFRTGLSPFLQFFYHIVHRKAHEKAASTA